MNEDLKSLTTERRNPNTMNIDTLNSLEIIKIMNSEDKKVTLAIEKELPAIAEAIDYCKSSFEKGGRIIYMGAGTSGRIGLLDAVECPPTYNTPNDRIIGLISGGKDAFIKAAEGAEDSAELGKEDLKNLRLTKDDVVIGIAASGRTPYVIGGFEYAKEIGAYTVSISANKNAKMSSYADTVIEVDSGEEVVTGSTRLKAGTMQKLVLNMISTATMIQMGKVYQNLMVDVQQTNIKLVERARKIVIDATGCTYEIATQKLNECENSAKLAITSILLNCDVEDAKSKLNLANGHISKAIK